MFFFLVFFSLLLAVSVTNRVAEMDGDDNGTAFYLSKYPLAMCLDGTAGAYTFRAGLETERFLIFHEGGGACESISDCTYVTHTRTHTRTCVHQMQSCIYIYMHTHWNGTVKGEACVLPTSVLHYMFHAVYPAYVSCAWLKEGGCVHIKSTARRLYANAWKPDSTHAITLKV